MTRKLIAMLLAVVMIVSCLPMSVLAADVEEIEAPEETCAEEPAAESAGAAAETTAEDTADTATTELAAGNTYTVSVGIDEASATVYTLTPSKTEMYYIVPQSGPDDLKIKVTEAGDGKYSYSYHNGAVYLLMEGKTYQICFSREEQDVTEATTAVVKLEAGETVSGCCAESSNITWEIDMDHHITLTGTGELAIPYTYNEENDWYSWYYQIWGYQHFCFDERDEYAEDESAEGEIIEPDGVFIAGEGITSIGIGSCDVNDNECATFYIPASVTKLDIYALGNLWNYDDSLIPVRIYYGGTQEQWNALSPEDDAKFEYLELPLVRFNSTPEDAMNRTITGTWYQSRRMDETVSLTLDDEGTLTVGGSGKLAVSAADHFGVLDLMGDCYSKVVIGGTIELAAEDSCHMFGSSALKEIVLENGIETISESAFSECTMTSITIPDSVTSIGADAFHLCSNLASVTIPDSVVSIGARAFYGCPLTSVTIPGSVTEIGEGTFDCAGCLKEVNYYGSEAEWKALAGENDIFGTSDDVKVNYLGKKDCDHTWDEGTVTTAPTCTEDGVMTYTCTVCGGTKTEAIAAPGTDHIWDEGTVTTAPTCTADGVMTYTCTVCGETKTEAIPAPETGHIWDEGTVTTAPTCTADGVMTYTCTVCGETKTEAIAALGTDHTWDAGTVVTMPTFTTAGEASYTCTVCGETKTETIAVLQNKAFNTILDKTYYYLKDKKVTGWKTIKTGKVSNRYYFDPITGVMQTDWLKITKGKKTVWYCFDPDTGVMLTGVQEVDGEYYDFSSAGVLRTGIQTVKEGKISNKYYFDPASGVRTTGWVDIIEDTTKSWYYFDPDNSGIMTVNTMKEIDGETYCFDTSGVMLTGMQTYNKQKYYFGTDGAMRYGKQSVTSGKKTVTYFFDTTSGAMVKNSLVDTDDGTCYFNKSGVMATGLQTYNKQKYYFDPDTGVMQTGKVTISSGKKDKTYYFNTAEDVAADSTLTLGAMYSGWKQLDDGWHYFKSGIMVVSKKLKINKVSYTFDANGVCAAYNG